MIKEVFAGKLSKCKHPYPWEHLNGEYYRCFKCGCLFSIWESKTVYPAHEIPQPSPMQTDDFVTLWMAADEDQ